MYSGRVKPSKPKVWRVRIGKVCGDITGLEEVLTVSTTKNLGWLQTGYIHPLKDLISHAKESKFFPGHF